MLSFSFCLFLFSCNNFLSGTTFKVFDFNNFAAEDLKIICNLGVIFKAFKNLELNLKGKKINSTFELNLKSGAILVEEFLKLNLKLKCIK